MSPKKHADPVVNFFLSPVIGKLKLSRDQYSLSTTTLSCGSI